jgi:hypothetical protein
MTITEAKAFLGDRYVLSPNYRLEDNPQHSLHEPVNVRLTFAHVKYRAVTAVPEKMRKAA